MYSDKASWEHGHPEIEAKHGFSTKSLVSAQGERGIHERMYGEVQREIRTSIAGASRRFTKTIHITKN